MSTLRPALLASPIVVALALAGAACRGGAAGASGDPAMEAIEARMPGGGATALDATAGFLADGVGYVAVRPKTVVSFLQSLPLPDDAKRDLDEASRELGVDLRTGDVLGYLGIDSGAMVTMTLMRPLVSEADARALLDAVANRPPRKVDGFPGIGDGALPDDLRRRVGVLGGHSRIHVPLSDPAKLAALLKDKVKPSSTNDAEALCREVGATDFCHGDRTALVLTRKEGSAQLIDVFNFAVGEGSYGDAERVAAVKAALAAPAATLPVLRELRGDLVGYVDGPQVAVLANTDAIASLTASASYLDDAGYAEEVARVRRRLEGLDKVRGTRRLLRGLRGEASFTDGNVRATFAWEPVDAEAATTLDRLLSHPANLDAPSLAALCADAILCYRTTGLPALAPLGEIATGTYAAPARDFGQAVDAGDDLAGVALFLETWPNALGAAQRWMKEEMRGPEAAIVGGIVDSIGHFEGSGGSLRSLQVQGGDPRGDFVGYVRAASQELNLLRGLLGFGGLRFAPLQLQSVGAKVESVQIPDAPGSLFIATDPAKVKIGEQETEVGWMIVADAPDRLSWLLGLPRDRAVHPSAYYEVDLVRLVGSVPEVAGELGSARAWLEGRTVRGSLAVIAGRPRIDLYFGKPPAAAR